MLIKDRIRLLCDALVEQGNRMFKTDVVLDRIEYFPCGGFLGWAQKTGRTYFIRFNQEHIEKHPSEFFNETLPHEVAHLIVFCMKAQGRSRDKGHGVDFKRVCRALGGTGARCGNAGTVTSAARVTKKYEYVLPNGEQFWLGLAIHKKMQTEMGYYRSSRISGEFIQKKHFTGQMKMKGE